MKAETPTRIQSVRRAAAALEVVARASGGVRAAEMAAALEVPLPTAYHLLNTLTEEGLLTKLDDRRYQLGPRVGVLAEAFAAQISAPEHLVARLRELSDRTGETSYLSAWRRGDSVLLSIIEGRQAVRVSGLHLGYSGLTHARASGKVLLAYGPPGTIEAYLQSHAMETPTRRTVNDGGALQAEAARTRAAGYAVDEEEFAEGVSCVAAPVADGSMAIGISAPSERFRERRAELIDTVVEIASMTMIPSLRSATA
ncbi:MAG: IclR family transcriptional regulator [Gaiellales bacterium]|jgi:IclR family acetate operon transcriptional repressor